MLPKHFSNYNQKLKYTYYIPAHERSGPLSDQNSSDFAHLPTQPTDSVLVTAGVGRQRSTVYTVAHSGFHTIAAGQSACA